MPEYIYLLENRLTPAQKHVVARVRDAAREAGTTVFLTGGAVRDLTTGSSVRNFDFTVQGNALDLEAALTARGGALWGRHEPTRSLTFWFPGSVRVSVSSARTEEYPKPGKPVYHWSSIVEDLRRRDFTANAMALSLNEGSYGLLLDPLNGVADIEARLLRIASNYGFIEDPSRLIRAVRLRLRLGWQLEERTAQRYANAKEAEAIKALAPYLRGYELEKIASEEDALDTVKALEAEGWLEHLLPGWTSAQADVAGLENLRRNWIQLLMQGVIADLTAAHFELLTAKLDPTHIATLKKTMVHPGLLRHWEELDESAKEFGRQLTGKAAAAPSATWKLLTTSPAEPILWLAHTRKSGSAVDLKLKNFFTVWPEFKKKVPAAMMLEMRITPELPGYAELLEQLFYQLIDGNLETEEQMRAFLEPYSPPAPPPPPTVRRSRAKKSESKTKRRTAAPDDEDDDLDDDDDDAGDDADAEADPDAESEEAESAAIVIDDEEEVEDEALTSALDKLHGIKADELDEEDEEKDEEKDEELEAGSGKSRAGLNDTLLVDEGDQEEADDERPAARSSSSSSRGKTSAAAAHHSASGKVQQETSPAAAAPTEADSVSEGNHDGRPAKNSGHKAPASRNVGPPPPAKPEVDKAEKVHATAAKSGAATAKPGKEAQEKAKPAPAKALPPKPSATKSAKPAPAKSAAPAPAKKALPGKNSEAGKPPVKAAPAPAKKR